MSPKIPPTGRLSVKSNPRDAEIFINFKDTDLKTPETVSLSIGANLITLKKDKYSDYSFCVDIIEGETLEKKITLIKPTDKPIPTGTLSLESVPSHAEIYVNLEDTKKLTPEKLTLPEGTYLITLRTPDSEYDDLRFCAKIEKEELLEKFLELKKSTGELTITSTPTASNIWLKEYDDLKSRDTGFVTPQTLTLTPTLPEKPIAITLKREGHEDYFFDVEIEKGVEIEKFAELVKTEEEALGPIPPGKSRIRILSKPSYASIFIEEDTGKITPESIILDPGDYEITLKREGYEDKTISVTLEEGKELEKFVELTKTEGAVPSDKSGVKITSKPSSASIHISDKITSPLSTLTNLFPPVEDTGRITPELLILEPGLYGISLRKGGYEVRNVFVTIEEGKELEKFIELVKVEGVVSAEESGVKIVTKPSAASIFVNGEDIHRITPELIILDPKEYEITVKKEGYADKTVTITIEEGKQIEKFIQLTRIEGVVPPDKSGVKLTSKPTAASILIKGKDIGRITPELVLLEPGEHQITLKKPGYLDKITFITIEEGKEIERYIELTKVEEAEPPEKTGVKIVSKPSSASIYVNGEDIGRITPELILLDPGTYTVTLRKEGYNSRTVTIAIQEGKELEKFVELSKIEAPPEIEGERIGEFRIESRPELAEIWVRGGNTDLLTPETLTLTPGTKTIEIKKAGFDDYSFSITIVAGKKLEKFCKLTKSTGELFISSRPSRAKIYIGNEDTHLLTPEKLILSPGKKRIGLSYPAFLSAMYIVDIVKGGKIEKFHRFAIPRDAIKTNKDDSFDDNIHVRDYCMQCDNPPEYDVLFSEGNLRAWLCAEHCKAFVRESSEKINAIRRIDNGKATSKFRENINPNVLSRFIRDMQRISQKKQLVTDEELAPVNASGVELGEKIILKEILPYFKSFYHTKPYVSLIGGICNRGSTTGDIDIFINSNHRDLATEFRIVRSFPQDYWHRFNFRYPYQEKTHPGKFTNHVDIYDQKIEAIREPELVLMSVPKKVELFKSTFPLLKPAHGHYKGEEYSIDKLIEVVNAKPEWYEKGTYVQQKFDGVHVRCDVQKNYESGYDVVIWSEEGNDITKNLPTLRKELGEASKGHKISIVGELEFWEDEKHQSRQQTTAIIHTKEVHPDESKVILNAFDTLFYDKDIHNEAHSERLKSHAKLKETAHIKKADYTLVDSPTELRKAVEHYSDLPGSEGAYLKRADFPYELDGKSLLNLKYKNTFSIEAKVIDVHEVKDANAFNYLCVIEDDKGKDVPIGRTYNTSIKVSKGDILKVEFVNLSQYTDPDSKKAWFNWWSPRVLMPREDKTKPDNTLTAEKLVEASKGTVAEKPWPKRYESDDAPLILHPKGEFTPGKIVKVNDKIGIVSKIIGGG